jgi:hypothetical protein
MGLENCKDKIQCTLYVSGWGQTHEEMTEVAETRSIWEYTWNGNGQLKWSDEINGLTKKQSDGEWILLLRERGWVCEDGVMLHWWGWKGGGKDSSITYNFLNGKRNMHMQCTLWAGGEQVGHEKTAEAETRSIQEATWNGQLKWAVVIHWQRNKLEWEQIP